MADTTFAAPPGVAKPEGGRRWLIIALLFVATTVNYVDRTMLGLLAPTLGKELHWSEDDYGTIVTAFQAAYAFGQPIFGRVVDILGTRKGYSLAILGWSVAAIGHGRDEGQLYANCALRPAVPECPHFRPTEAGIGLP